MSRTILFSDIVESTRTIEEVGDDVWRSLIEHHLRIASDLARRHEGEIVNFTGDGMMAAFKSPVEGVACALRLRLAYRIVGQLEVRLGLHHGPIARTEQGYVGLTAHIASRLTDLSGAGEVTMSSACYQQAQCRLALPRLVPHAVVVRGISERLNICTISDEVTAWA